MNTLKKIMPFLLAFVLVVSMAPAALAAEITEADTYVLQRVDATGDSHGPNIQYSSLYVPDFTYNNAPDYYQTNIYTMYDTRTGDVIPVYCTDVTTGAYAGKSYRRLNLEDSNFSGSSAGQIRAILLNGFYIEPVSGESDEAHTTRAKAKAAALGAAAGIEGPDLTVSEAISATQCAIWQAAHGSQIQFKSFVRAYPNSGSCKYQTLCFEDKTNGHVTMDGSNFSEESIAFVNERIRTVFNYLLSLEPVAATSKVVSSASFKDLSKPVFTLNEDGTYTVAMATTVDVQMAGGDSLTLKAELGTLSKSVTIQNGGTHNLSFTFNDVPAELFENDTYLTISGQQTASGFFLFDAVGSRGESQSMVGTTNSRMPVYARVRLEENRVLSFVKTTPGGRPLEGIIFDIFPVATLSEYLDGKVLPEPEDYVYPTKPEYTIITDINGEASFDLTQHGLPDGVYLVVERAHPAIVMPVSPFYVILPATSADGKGYDYTITVRPKNEVKGSIDIEKDVISLGNDEATVDAVVPHTWIIGASIPEDIDQGKSYVVTDTLDNRLDYVGNMKVAVETADGQVIALLEEDVHYTLDLTDLDSVGEGKPSDAFRLELTPAGMAAVAEAAGEGAMLRIRYDAKLNANAEFAETVPNQAIVEYTNSVNFIFTDTSDKPVVYTGAANLLKVDAADHNLVLPGAVFEVYRPATSEEVQDENVTTVNLKGHDAPMVKVSFYDNIHLDGAPVTSVTSDEKGQLAVCGLAYGTYYLVETQSPVGYNLLGDPLELTISENSHLEQNVVVVENMSGTVMPETGGMGTSVYVFTGTLLMAVSVLLLLAKKRRAI